MAAPKGRKQGNSAAEGIIRARALWLESPADEEGTGILQRVYRSATTCLKCRIAPPRQGRIFRIVDMDFGEFTFYALG